MKRKLINTFLLVCLSNLFVSYAYSIDNDATRVIGKNIFGLTNDFQGDPLLINDSPLIHSQPDFAFEISISEQSYFEIALFNADVASVYLSYLSQDDKAAYDTRPVDLGSISGAHSIGHALKSAWNTVLFSEQAMVNADNWADFGNTFKPYFKNNEELVKPYHYGWLNEVIVLDAKGSAKAIKNYVAGRTFASNIFAMPDGKTFYFHDKRHSGHLYLFIAEEPNSFAKGKLYVISEDLNAIELGGSSALKMKFKLKKAGFNQFFKTKKPDGKVCPSGFTFTDTVYGQECLKVQKKNRKYVGQFEPIRIAAIKGITPFLLEKSISFDVHQNVIILTHTTSNDAVGRETFTLVKNDSLNTDYFISRSK